LIDVAIVTTSTPSRKTARRANDTNESEICSGSIWTRRRGVIRRRTIECKTAAGIRLELEAYFERLMGKSLRVQVIQPVYGDEAVAKAVASLVPSPIHQAPHGYKQFSRSKKFDKESGVWRFTPFDYGFESQVHIHFRPDWYVEPEPMPLLRSAAGHFTYPATDDEIEETDK
jgi:hypothetical protein